MQLTLDLAHVFSSGSQPEENARALSVLLECLADLDEGYLTYHACPPLYRANVEYGRTEVWDTIPACLAKGFGDCKTLTAWRLAELRKAGIACKPVFRWTVNPSNPNVLDYHILVEYADGTLEDPSDLLGMNGERKV